VVHPVSRHAALDALQQLGKWTIPKDAIKGRFGAGAQTRLNRILRNRPISQKPG
jgi:hypothetical protein